jgi:hypothetical protein
MDDEQTEEVTEIVNVPARIDGDAQTCVPMSNRGLL